MSTQTENASSSKVQPLVKITEMDHIVLRGVEKMGSPTCWGR